MSLLKLGALLVLLEIPGRHASPPDGFMIRVDPPDRRDDLRIRFFISGEFGGYGGEESKPVGDDALVIPTTYEGKPAKDLKACFLWFLARCR